MNNKTTTAYQKAELLLDGKIYVPPETHIRSPLSRSTTGPDSGTTTIGLSSNGLRIKLEKTKHKKDTVFSLQQTTQGFKILKENHVFIKNVTILPILYHAPGQAFLNLSDKCIHKCKFCTTPLHDTKKFLYNYDKKQLAAYALKTLATPEVKALALTSGVYPSTDQIIKKMIFIIKKIREKNANLPIGVEPCVSTKQQLVSLKEAGANEIKINVQIPDKNLFNKLCPTLHQDKIYDLLHQAVNIFGKQKVTTNLLYGLGETTESILNTVEKLAEEGVVPTLRKVKISHLNQKRIEQTLNYKLPVPSAETMVNLAQNQKKILERHGLTTTEFDTMCHQCKCCDIVPFWDV